MDAVTASIRSAWITDEAGNSARFSSASAAGMSESRATLVRFLGCMSSIALDLQWRPTATADTRKDRSAEVLAIADDRSILAV